MNSDDLIAQIQLKSPTRLTWEWLQARAGDITKVELATYNSSYPIVVYGVPRGGIYAAQLVKEAWNTFHKRRVDMILTEDPTKADIYVDDVLDSGKTINALYEKYGKKPTYYLVDKPKFSWMGSWVQFPWERMCGESGPEDNVRRLLQFIGDNPTREGLKDTPKRVVKAWAELFGGYKEDPAKMLTVFEDGACDEMVLLKNIEFTSHCEHHVLPFMGKAHIAYVPHKRVIGVSKLVRLLEVYSRRLQIQERLCQQVTSALDEHLKPLASACIIESSHLCMVCRGVKKQHSIMVTSSLTGLFKHDQAARQELMSLIKD